MLPLLVLPALAGDLHLLPQATCDALAAGFAGDVILPGGSSRLPTQLPIEELRASVRKLEGEFKQTCPKVRGLDAGCVRAVDAILDVAQAVGAGNAAQLEGKLPAEISHCMDAGGIDLLIRALDRPARMCDPRKPEARWAGSCAAVDPGERVRADLRGHVRGLKTAESAYDATYDGFLSAGSEAAARAAIAGATPYVWTADEAWTHLGWSPEPPVIAGFWVLVTKDANGDPDFEAHGIVDTDRDGCAYHLVATKSTNPTVVPGTETCR